MAKVHKPGERAEKPDAVYTPGLPLDPDAGRTYGDMGPVRDLLAFVRRQRG